MSVPFAIDNDAHRLADVLNELLAQIEGKPFDVATAYFSISGYRLVKEKLHQVGAFRFLIGSDPAIGADVGLKPNRQRLQRLLAGDLEAEPFTEATLRLVEELIAFLRTEKVEVRLFDQGFLHAKAYLFHQDWMTDQNRADRMRPFAAIVGSSNFTGPGLTSNRELNLVHRVVLPEEKVVDREAAERTRYLRDVQDSEGTLDLASMNVPDEARRSIKSEVGARAVTDLMQWYETQWAEAADFKEELIELLDASKFGTKEYTPYEVYMKALYEYFKDELGADAPELGRSAIDLAEFQEDAVKKARRILSRYDGVLIADSVGLGKTWIGKKVLVFSSFKDTTRYIHRRLTEDTSWLAACGHPYVRRIDSGNHPDERGQILAQFAPIGSGNSQPPDKNIDVLISTDVLSEGQNLQDCGAIVNYDLTWNPIRLVQRNGRIDRIGSPHRAIAIHNMFPEVELEKLLHLVERLMGRISTIDDLGLLDASVLGEVVHPRTFNTIRRIRDEDGTVLDEEEARAELAGPEMLLKHLKELLSRESSQHVDELPNGIHSGLRRARCNGMFFYFQAPRSGGEGKRHFWRYIDAASHDIKENRYEIAQLIACHPDEPRYIGDQDVFDLQEKVIHDIMTAEQQIAARSMVATAVDPIQQTVTETIKDSIRRRSVERKQAKTRISFLSQPMGRALHKKLKAAFEQWMSHKDDAALASEVTALAHQFAKDRPRAGPAKQLKRADLELICFEYVTG